MKILNLKIIKNKSNGQINLSLPKKKLPKKFIEELNSIQSVKINLRGWK